MLWTPTVAICEACIFSLGSDLKHQNNSCITMLFNLLLAQTLSNKSIQKGEFPFSIICVVTTLLNQFFEWIYTSTCDWSSTEFLWM